jgi:EmrB/QacA subfamily drug resistance transporter
MGMQSDDPKRWRALAVIAVAQLMIVLDATIVNVALPTAQRDLGISTADRQWVVTAYTLTFGGLLLLGGRIADYTGRKRTFIMGLIGFALASALGGLAPTAGWLFAARALQGAFAAVLAPAALSLITVTFVAPKERARAFGVFGAISGGGAAIGLVVGGVLTEYASWRWCLGVNTPIALITAAFAVYEVHESKAAGDTRYDIPGAVLSTLGLVSLVYGFTEAAKPKHPANPNDTAVRGWLAPSTITFLIVAVILLVAFVLWEQRTTNPLLPLRIVLDRNRGGSYLMFLLVGAGLFAMFLFLTYYFQINLGYSPVQAGLAFLPFSGGIIVAAGVVAQLLPRVGPRPLIIPGLVLSILGMLLLVRIGDNTPYVTYVLPAELLMSVGLAAVFIPAASTALIGGGAPRRRCRQRRVEQLAAGWRLPGHGPAQYRVRGHRDGLPRGERPHTARNRSADTDRTDPRLSRLVRLGCRALHRRAPLRCLPDQREKGGRADRGRRAGRLVEAHP